MNRLPSVPESPIRLRPMADAFTLVEVLVAVTILLVIMAALFQLSATLASVWTSSKGKISSFENARLAFGTLNTTLNRATLNTYTDYVDKTGAYRNASDQYAASQFVPARFGRASELHFISGPTSEVLVPLPATAATNPYGTTPPAPAAATNPGHAVLFQAPLGTTTKANFSGMNRTLNSVGFYIQFGPPPAGIFPNWLTATTAATESRFRLLEYVEPAENLSTYYSASKQTYDSGWIGFAAINLSTTLPASGGTLVKPRARVLADDVLLLVIRPRLSEAGESALIKAHDSSASYDPAKAGSILCPNYEYDSRAWMGGYPTDQRVNQTYATPALNDSAFRRQVMCNQVPPIMDLAMVCADSLSLAHFPNTAPTGSATLPTPNASLTPAPTLFLDASKMEDDLKAYALQLSQARLHFHVMRSSVQIESARWSNN